MTPDDVVAVAVPATSANLGPGFDAMAVALDLHLVVATTDRQDRRVIAGGLGADELPDGDDNLVWRALVAYCERFGADVPDVSLRTRNDVPVERGLGSSAAAAVAGVTLGRAVTRAGGRDAELVRLVAELEGHPDNAAAAVLGGLVVVLDGHPWRLAPSDHLRPVVCVPAARQSTAAARAVLPSAVELADAAANGARAAVVLAGLAGAMAWNPTALRDALHEPARLAVMTGTRRVIEDLRGAGVGACLSGAGPSVLAIVRAGDEAAVQAVRDIVGEEWEVRPSRWDLAGAAACPPTVVTGRG